MHPAAVSVSGYKHAATVIIAASIINSNQDIVLENIPNISDIKFMSQIINDLGGNAEQENNTLHISSNALQKSEINNELSQHIHGAIYFLPVILGRLKHVEIGRCGGCQIGDKSILGDRPIDHMLHVLEKFGANFEKKIIQSLGNVKHIAAALSTF